MKKPTSRRIVYALSLALALATIAVFGQVVTFEFVNYDDNGYVYENPWVSAGLTTAGARWAFRTFAMGHWHPLTWLSLMCDAQVASWVGMHDEKRSAAVFHLTNVVIHTVNVLLLFILLNSMTRMPWRSAFAAGLFAVHPLHVESVAWISQRKDLLSALFWFLAMSAYVRYSSQPSRAKYALIVLFFVLGLMAKSMLVTLPVILLLVDFWPLGRFELARDARTLLRRGPVSCQNRRLLLEKLPLLGLSLCSVGTAYLAQRANETVVSVQWFGLERRLVNALVSYFAYVIKMLWPTDLAAVYPLKRAIPDWQILVAAIFLIGATTAAMKCVRTASLRWIFVGWFWYTISLLPVIGLVQVGSQAMADRYTYVPLVGLFIIGAWGVPIAVEKLVGWPGAKRAMLSAAGAGVIIVLAFLAHAQVGYWKNSLTLYGHTLRVTTDNPVAESNYAVALTQIGRLDEAVKHYEKAVSLRPHWAEGRAALGTLLAQMGRFPEAEDHLRRAVELDPSNTRTRNNLGATLLAQRKVSEAIEQLGITLRIDPNNEDARRNLEQARRIDGGQ